MSDTKSYAKQRCIKHIITADENTGNEAMIQVISGLPSSDFPTDDFIYQINVTDNAYTEKTEGMKHLYDVNSGVVNLHDGGTNLATGDIVQIIGSFV